MSEPIPAVVECDGLCLDSADIGVPGYGVAYPHPGCPLHAPGERCKCGQPDRCTSYTHDPAWLAAQPVRPAAIEWTPGESAPGASEDPDYQTAEVERDREVAACAEARGHSWWLELEHQDARHVAVETLHDADPVWFMNDGEWHRYEEGAA